MSNASAASILAQEEADMLQELYASSYCFLAATALIFFEYIVTFSEEVRVIWGARFTTFRTESRLVAYSTEVSSDGRTVTCSAQSIGCRSCEAVNVLENVSIIVLEAVTASFSAFRTYAISGHQIVPALLVLLLGLAPVGDNIFANTGYSYSFVTYVGRYPVCNSNQRESVAIQKKTDPPLHRLVIFDRICAAVSDLIVVLVTWFKTAGLAMEVRKLRLRGSIATVLMRDGTLYFMALLLLNVLEIVITLHYVNSQASLPVQLHGCSKVTFKQNPANYVTVFQLPISSILISRLILNLRQVSLGSVGLNTISLSAVDTPDIPSRLVGNIGAELQHSSLVFENVEDNMEDEQGMTEGCETYELEQVQ
ncbi:uncharacterized protein LAESUDRAFT_816054 [Laetiporus sulphureus 93-53]|uniref:DUF6533 domain-containing protein n=1 Tax=Laetiporus sulphureus 93-53 TaxID=1314785 RepID=A0A165BIS6_9APHY|nr:uncharacterized protein LAESUDRAFT_816054 [Laetiporus sulphureus 93-53]KZT01136.1 hypothetical protein LAESUDRAFT_816054 [Laetiporus sulphureus 93-53]